MTTENNGGNALALKVKTVRDLLTANTEQIRAALPRHITPERMLRVCMTAIARTPKLMDCTKQSLLSAIIECASVGLEPTGILGHGYLIPYKDKATFLPGYRGLIDLARRGGNVISIHADCAHKGDLLEFEQGTAAFLKHTKRAETERLDGNILAFYACAKTKDGGEYFEVMYKDEVDKIRCRSKSPNDGPWVTDYAEMGKKTVLRRLCKSLPVSIECQKLALREEYVDAGVSIDAELDGESTPEEIAEKSATPEPERPKLTNGTHSAKKEFQRVPTDEARNRASVSIFGGPYSTLLPAQQKQVDEHLAGSRNEEAANA